MQTGTLPSCTIVSRTKLIDKRGDFKFPIMNFPFICSKIPTGHTYGVYISQ